MGADVGRMPRREETVAGADCLGPLLSKDMSFLQRPYSKQVRGHKSSSFLGIGGVVGSAYRGAGILHSTQGFSPSAETDLDFIFFNNIAVNIPWLMVPRRAQDS